MRQRRLWTVAGAATLACGLLMAACTSEPYGTLILPGELSDTLIVYPRPVVRQLAVMPDPQEGGLGGMQSLYLGASGGTRSHILVNYDFGDLGDRPGLDSLLTSGQIRSVSLWLHRLLPYTWQLPDSLNSGGRTPSALYFLVRRLESPFLSADYHTAPGPVPAAQPAILNSNFLESSTSDEPRLRLYVSDFLAWVQAGQKVGFSIEAGAESDSGLVGFASRELTSYQELPPITFGTEPAPAIVVEFRDESENLIIGPSEDTSTFSNVAPLTPGVLTVQTGLRSYPVLSYDLPTLPSGTAAAALSFQLLPGLTDPLQANECLDLSYIDTTRVDLDADSIDLDNLGYAATPLFDVCPNWSDDSPTRDWAGRSSERYFIGELPSSLHLLLNFDMRARAGNIYVTRSTFQGPAAAPDDQPVLMIIVGPKGD